MGIGASRDVAVIEWFNMFASNLFNADDTLVRSHVRKCRTMNNITDGINAFDIGTVVIVNLNFALLSLNTGLLQSKPLEVGCNTDSRKYDLCLNDFFAFFGLNGYLTQIA